MKYVNELGGFVPIRDENMETTVKGVFVAGDVSGVEEASSAMVEGYLAGIAAAESLGITVYNIIELKEDLHQQLNALRSGPAGKKIRKGISVILAANEAAAAKDI